MSDYQWCHGPQCHRKHTQDRIRGVKGSKVLRTRKIAINKWNKDSLFSVFCSQTCYTEFFYKYWQEVIAIAPRLEALETPIDVEVVKHPEETTPYGWTRKAWTEKRITEVDNA
jgi:hypothetical protein